MRGKLKIISILFIGCIFSATVFYYFSLLKQKKEQQQVLVKNISEIKTLELPKVFNGIKTMVLIPGGTFMMGDNNSNFPDEKPERSVAVESFYMDETPITYEDFIKYIEDGGTESRYWKYDTYNQPGNPISGINWYHAINYCNWRSEKEGLKPAYKSSDKLDAWGYSLWELDNSENGYRLPTEEEFEYAARGGLVGKKFPWGNAFDSLLAKYDDERGVMTGGWWRLAKVKDAKPNNYGLYGMSGNVWQWTNGWYNPRTKVIRGGSWGSISPEYLRVSKRSFMAPSNYNYDVGFRCVRPAVKVVEISDQNLITENFGKFYKYETARYDRSLQINPYSEEFIDRLGQYITDYYSNSIYFQIKVDEQEIISPHQMARLIVETAKEYSIHPLFLAGIIASESGFGCCSFPRWYNNPMAYHWQNALMKNGPPLYDADNARNEKYKDLRNGFRRFAQGIKKDIYLNAAEKDLDAFHLLYVGYRADEWMYTLSKVYKDVLGIKLEPHMPANNVGEYIYINFNKSSANVLDDIKIIDRLIDWGHYTSTKVRAIDTIIIHSSYNALGKNIYSVDGVIYEYKLYTAGPHYLIARDGAIYRLVQEKDIGYHAGASKMPDGRTNINDFSIGI